MSIVGKCYVPLESGTHLGGQARTGRTVATLLHEFVEDCLLQFGDVRGFGTGRTAATAAASFLSHRARLLPRPRQLITFAFGSGEPNKWTKLRNYPNRNIFLN